MIFGNKNVVPLTFASCHFCLKNPVKDIGDRMHRS